MKIPFELDKFTLYGYVFLQLVRFFKEQRQGTTNALVMLIMAAYVIAKMINRNADASSESGASDDKEEEE